MKSGFVTGGIAFVVATIVSFYLIAYTFPLPARVISNSTGAWGSMANSPGVFTLAAILIPLGVVVAFVWAYMRKGGLT